MPAKELADVVTEPVDGPPQPTEATGGAELPEEILQLPVMQALVAGSPPAVSDDLEAGAQTPFGQAIQQYGPMMQEAGFGFYRSNDGSLGVVFNQLHVNPQDIVEADNSGRLLELAPPVSQVESAIVSNPSANPVLGEGQVPEGAALASGGGSAPQGGVPPAQNKALANARRKNVQPQGPTDQARPGAGKILNAILKPVV